MLLVRLPLLWLSNPPDVYLSPSVISSHPVRLLGCLSLCSEQRDMKVNRWLGHTNIPFKEEAYSTARHHTMPPPHTRIATQQWHRELPLRLSMKVKCVGSCAVGSSYLLSLSCGRDRNDFRVLKGVPCFTGRCTSQSPINSLQSLFLSFLSVVSLSQSSVFVFFIVFSFAFPLTLFLVCVRLQR